MIPNQPTDIPKVAVVLFDDFSPFHVSIPGIVFSSKTLHETLFELTFVAGETGTITSDIGMIMQHTTDHTTLETADIIIVPYWRSAHERPNQAIMDALCRAHVRGALVVGLCLGAYVLAYAGLLSDKRAATHWELERDFTQRFPNAKLDTNALYVEDSGVITSAGTAAGMDCCLYIFRKYYNGPLVNRLARRLVVQPYRDGGQAQFIDQPVPITTSDVRINELMAQTRQRINKRYSLDELADSVMMTRRTFTRKFHKATGMAFGEWLANERLTLAQDLLESTELSIETIAEQTGFNSALNLRNKFKERFSVTPNHWRKTFKLDQ